MHPIQIHTIVPTKLYMETSCRVSVPESRTLTTILIITKSIFLLLIFIVIIKRVMYIFRTKITKY